MTTIDPAVQRTQEGTPNPTEDVVAEVPGVEPPETPDRMNPGRGQDSQQLWRTILRSMSNAVAGRDPMYGMDEMVAGQARSLNVDPMAEARASIDSLFQRYGADAYRDMIPPMPHPDDVPSTLDLNDLGDVVSGRDGIPTGLKRNAATGAALVRRQFGFNGQIGGIGQRNNKSDHPHGNAIDVMTNEDRALGRSIAQFFVEHAQELGVKYVIFEQTIWSPRDGWKPRPMEDRGSPTANHMDHPHISFY